MNSQVIDKIKEILGLPTEEVALETQPLDTHAQEIKLMDWKLEDGRIIKIDSENSVTIDGEVVADGDYMVTNPNDETDIRVLRVKDGKVLEIIDALPTDGEPTPTEEPSTPSLTELYADYEELSTLFEDLNSRLTIIEGMMMQSQKDQEKLASIVDILKNLPSGEPIVKKETSEGSFKKNKPSKNENKFYSLGQLMKNNK